MPKLLRCLMIGALAAALPLVASAAANFNFDTGAAVSSGGDITFNGTSIAPVGSAKLYSMGTTGGSTEFSALSGAALVQLAGAFPFSTTPINGSSLANGELFLVHTSGGNYAKVLLTAVSSSSITFSFATYTTSGSTVTQGTGVTLGSGGGASGPSITMVQNNYSWVLPNAPNYGIAPGSIMTIIGAGMADNVPLVLQSSASPGIPTTLNHASVSVTVNGTTVHPGLYYAVPTLIAAVLPSSTPTGTGTLTVTYNGTPSAPVPITVVPSALGFDSLSSSGTGPSVAQDASTYALFSPTSSAKPGENIVLWGSGLGADTADSDTVYTSTPHAINTPLQIFIGGVSAKILYQGASGYPGLNQIDVTIPANVPTGCAVSLSAVTGTGSAATASNILTMPIAAGGGTCTDPLSYVDPTTGATLSGKGTVKYGGVFIAHTTSSTAVTDIATASFYSESGAVFSGYQSSSQPSLGSCTINQYNTSNVPPLPTGLNAGTITVQGPNGSQQLQSFTTGTYLAELPTGFIPSSGGTFTFSGTGGSDVPAFSGVGIPFFNPLVWTNASADGTVTRSSGVPVNWTGGAPGTFAEISGNSISLATGFYGGFVCTAPVSQLTFTVPPAVLLALPAGTGSLSVSNYTYPASANIPGLDFSFKMAFASTDINATYN